VAQRIVVTLIHGTWARNAPWTRPAARDVGPSQEQEAPTLRQAIEDAFPGGVEFRTFDWSGRNSLGARQDEARRLRNQLLANPTSDPGVRHFLVAHSHGGNIALYALRDPDVRNRIAGVATLATPFLIAGRRDLGSEGKTILVLELVALGALAGILAYVVWPSALIAGAVAAGAFALPAYWFAYLDARVDQVIADMQLPVLEPEQLWIGRLIGDEAAAGLQTGQLTGWAAAHVHRWFGRAYARAEKSGASQEGRSLGLVLAGLGLVGLTWLAGERISVTERPAFVLWSFIAVAGVGFLIFGWGLLPQLRRVVVPYAAVVLLPLVAILSSLLALPFGRERAFYGLLLDVHSEPTPLGTWTVHQYASADGSAVTGQTTPALVHSRIYGHEQALLDLTTWMTTCPALKSPATARPPD
jgi:hypothetical protein